MANNFEASNEQLSSLSFDKQSSLAYLAFQEDLTSTLRAQEKQADKPAEQPAAKADASNEVQQLIKDAAKDATPKLEQAIKKADDNLKKTADEVVPKFNAKKGDIEKASKAAGEADKKLAEAVDKVPEADQEAAVKAAQAYLASKPGSQERTDAAKELNKHAGLTGAIDNYEKATQNLQKLAEDVGMNKLEKALTDRISAGRALAQILTLSGDQAKAAEVMKATQEVYVELQKKLQGDAKKK